MSDEGEMNPSPDNAVVAMDKVNNAFVIGGMELYQSTISFR